MLNDRLRDEINTRSWAPALNPDPKFVISPNFFHWDKSFVFIACLPAAVDISPSALFFFFFLCTDCGEKYSKNEQNGILPAV